MAIEKEEGSERAMGLTCFMNSERECGPDCMAYTTFSSESPHLSDQQKHCSLIVGVERLGRFTGGILKHLKDSEADKIRKNTNVPDPKGG